MNVVQQLQQALVGKTTARTDGRCLAEMLGELSLDGGCVPSPEETSHANPSRQKNGVAGEPDELSAARRRIAELEAEVCQTRNALHAWSLAASSLVNVLLMNPRQTGNYSAEVSRLLESALGSLSFVEKVRYVNCSFPSASANAPRVRLVHWRSIEDSEWEMRFAPAWSCEVCVDGKQLISFSTLVRVLNAQIQGRLKLAFSHDLARLSISFVKEPETNVDVDCGVIVGHLPLPIRETMGNLIRDVARAWIRDNLVAPKRSGESRAPPIHVLLAVSSSPSMSAAPTSQMTSLPRPSGSVH